MLTYPGLALYCWCLERTMPGRLGELDATVPLEVIAHNPQRSRRSFEYLWLSGLPGRARAGGDGCAVTGGGLSPV